MLFRETENIFIAPNTKKIRKTFIINYSIPKETEPNILGSIQYHQCMKREK
jgi:hypothetical protein